MQRLFVSLAVVFLGCLAVPATLNAYDAADYLKSGDAWRERGEYGKALAEYNQALRLDPNNAAAMYDIARLEATCPDEKYRDGRKAFENANKAYQLSGGEDWGRTDTLAAVYAECGDFDKARAWEAKAIAMAPDEKSKEISRSRLELYKQGKPYREGPGAQLKNLQQDRVEALSKLADIYTTHWRAGLLPFFRLAMVQNELVKAQLELAEKPAERVALLTSDLNRSRDICGIAEARYRVQQMSEADCRQQRAVVLDIQTKLWQEEIAAGMPGNP